MTEKKVPAKKVAAKRATNKKTAKKKKAAKKPAAKKVAKKEEEKPDFVKLADYLFSLLTNRVISFKDAMRACVDENNHPLGLDLEETSHLKRLSGYGEKALLHFKSLVAAVLAKETDGYHKRSGTRYGESLIEMVERGKLTAEEAREQALKCVNRDIGAVACDILTKKYQM